MAWPLSRITDFIARQTKITAAFLNAVQDWVIALSAATVTLKAVVVDGTGGAAATPVAGTVKVSRQAATSGVPGVAMVPGQLNRGQVAIAWGKINGNAGTVLGNFGIKSLTRVSTGVYTLVIDAANAPSDPDLCSFWFTANQNDFTFAVTAVTQPSDTSITITVKDGAGPADVLFYFGMFGE